MKPFKFFLFLYLLLVYVAAQTIHIQFNGNGKLTLLIQRPAPADQTSVEKEWNTNSEDSGIFTQSTMVQILINVATVTVLVHYLINKYIGERDIGMLTELDMESIICKKMPMFQDACYIGLDEMEEMVNFEDVAVEPETFMATATIVLQ